MTPASLYLAQLAERLGPQALRNIGYASTNPASASVWPAAQLPTPVPSQTGPATGVTESGENLALNRPVLTTNMRGGNRAFAGWQALDEDDQTYWATDDGVAPAQLELDTEGALVVNTLELCAAAGKSGGVQRYRIEGFTESAWKLLAEGTTIGERKRDVFPRVTVWKIRLTILKAEPYGAISKLGLYLARDE